MEEQWIVGRARRRLLSDSRTVPRISWRLQTAGACLRRQGGSRLWMPGSHIAALKDADQHEGGRPSFAADPEVDGEGGESTRLPAHRF